MLDKQDPVALFDLCAGMLDSLHDGHVNLYTPFDVSHSTAWYDTFPANYNSQIQAMYMQNPRRILGSFMMRNDKFRVRIDDVQHNIGGYYLYWKNYDAMLAAGLDPCRMDVTDNLD